MSDWGAGQVMLLEIPTVNELNDNVVAMWEPAQALRAGQSMKFRYRQHWTMDPDPAESGGYVVATRSGLHDWEPNCRTVLVEFSGPKLLDLGEQMPEAMVEILCDGSQRAKIGHVTVQRVGDERLRASFQILPADPAVKLAEIGALELRACLKRGEEYLTETWASRITP